MKWAFIVSRCAFDPSVFPRCWLIVSEGRRQPRRLCWCFFLSVFFGGVFQRETQGLVKSPLTVTHPLPTTTMLTSPTCLALPGPLLYPPHTYQTETSGQLKAPIRLHSDLGEQSDLSLKFPLPVPLSFFISLWRWPLLNVCVHAVMRSQGVNEDRWLSVPGLCPLQSRLGGRDIGNRHLG